MTEIKAAAISGSKWTTASQLVLLLAALLQTAILARILLPGDFGLVAITSVIIGWLTIYSELGLSAAIIQRKETPSDVLSSLYLLNLFAALLCGLATIASASVLAKWYGQNSLQELLVCLSPAFILSAIGSQFRALNQKNLRFVLMAKIEIMAALLSMLTALILAFNGFGVYSLILSTLVNIGTSSALNLATGLQFHKPTLAFVPGKVGEFLHFGLYQMGENTLNYLNTQIDVLLVGKLSGTHALGLYSMSKGLSMRPASFINPIFNRVAFPVMSQAQNDQDGLRHMYLTGLRLLCFINFPIYAFLLVAAEPLVLILLGDSWLEAVPALQVLSMYFLVRSTGNPVGSLLMATGRYRRSFFWNLTLFALIPIAVWAGAHKGILGIAWALLILQLFLIIPNWFFLVKPSCNVGFSEYFEVQMTTLLAAAAAILSAWPVAHFTGNSWINLVAVATVGGLVYLAISLVINKKAIASARALI